MFLKKGLKIRLYNKSVMYFTLEYHLSQASLFKNDKNNVTFHQKQQSGNLTPPPRENMRI